MANAFKSKRVSHASANTSQKVFEAVAANTLVKSIMAFDTAGATVTVYVKKVSSGEASTYAFEKIVLDPNVGQNLLLDILALEATDELWISSTTNTTVYLLNYVEEDSSVYGQSVKSLVDWSNIDPTNGQVPVWNATAGEYIPGDVAAGGAVTSVNGESGDVILDSTEIKRVGSTGDSIDTDLTAVENTITAIAARLTYTGTSTDVKVDANTKLTIDAATNKAVLTINGVSAGTFGSTQTLLPALRLGPTGSTYDLPASRGTTTGQVPVFNSVTNTTSFQAVKVADLSGDSDDLAEGGTNLFLTSAERTKLTGITTVVSDVTGSAPIVSSGGTSPTISINAATTSAAGSMSAEDKTKLEGIQIGAEQNVQSNWTETNAGSDAFILNKPTLSVVATSGSYNDLSNLPTIPAAYTDSNVDAHLNTATATAGQVLSWTGSDYDWVNGGGGGAVVLDDLTDVTITDLIDHESLIYDEATLKWINGSPKALDLPVYSATAINKGKLVKAVGAVGDKISIALFDLDVDDPKFLLGVTVDNIVLGGTGHVKTYGELRGISTDLYALGTVLYASGTPGEFSSTAGNPEIPIAIVTRSQANTGRIFIRSWVPGVIHSFDKIAVAGQPVIVANSDASTLNIANSDGVTLTSDAGTDTLTIGFNKIGTLSEGAYLYWDTATGKIQSDSNVAVSQISSEVTFDYAVVMNQPVTIGNTLQAGDTILLSQSIYLGASGSAGTYDYGAVLMKNIFTGTGLSLGHIYSINSSGAAVLAINTTPTAEDMLVVSVGSNAANGVLVQGIVRLVTSLSGASKGQKVYLSNSSGGVTVTPPTASGSTVRLLGYVVDPANNKIYFNPSNDYLTLA